MKILVTGGAGFFGSHLIDRFITNHNITCLDNFSTGNPANVRHHFGKPNFKLAKGDVTNWDLMLRIIPHVDVIIHLAAQINTDRSFVEPLLTWDTNIKGTHNILELARRYDKKVIMASSSEVYGSGNYPQKMNEDHPLGAKHLYGVSKLCADRLCSSYKDSFGMDIAIGEVKAR